MSIKPSREYVFGINPLFEIVRGGRRRIYEGYLSKSSERNPRMKKLAEYLDRSEINWSWVEKGRVFDLAQNKDNQGAVLKVSPYPYVHMEDVFESKRVLLLDNVEDPHNVGAILRSAEIFGFKGVCTPIKGCPEIYPSVVKVSAGATEYLNIAKDGNVNRYAKRAFELGYRIVALDGAGKDSMASVQGQCEADDPVMLVIGGEDKGVGQFILNMAHHVIRINQVGRINSLNASVAAGIAMHGLGLGG
ncbi:MAG: RNA methyltransferase [Spartobacteria bacterium]|nr:RNA methyltransferase [Spartobacteria bacterium]